MSQGIFFTNKHGVTVALIDTDDVCALQSVAPVLCTE